MNIRFLGFSNSLQSLNRRQSLTNILLNKQNVGQSGKRDLFVRSTTYDAGTYTISAGQRSKTISDSILSAMNNDISKVRKHGDIYECEGTFFTADQIPKVDTSILSEIKACNNTIDFGQNNYFKYVSSDGKEHALFTNDKGVGAVHSEQMRGAEHDAVGRRYAHFWRYMMSDDPVYVGLTYTNDEIDEFMKNAGIEYGFFTIKMGDREASQYYTKSENTSAVQSKERYDSKYEHITSTGYELMNYEPGSVFKLNGKEYVLSENHTLDIPYGEDLWSLEDPSNYKFGKKVE